MEAIAIDRLAEKSNWSQVFAKNFEFLLFKNVNDMKGMDNK